MNSITKVFVFTVLFSALNARAFDTFDNQSVMLNIDLPLGASNKYLASPRLELRFDAVHSENNSVPDGSEYTLASNPALIELPLDQDGIHRLYVGGQNIMPSEGNSAADGDANADTGGLSTTATVLIVGGVALAGFLIYRGIRINHCLNHDLFTNKSC